MSNSGRAVGHAVLGPRGDKHRAKGFLPEERGIPSAGFRTGRHRTRSFSSSGPEALATPISRRSFSPAVTRKLRIVQFQGVTHFGPQREFERPRYLPEIRFRTLAKQRMGRGPGKPCSKRTCDVLKKDLRKQREFEPGITASTKNRTRTRS